MNYFIQESERLLMRKLTKDDIPTWTKFFQGNSHLNYLGIDLRKPAAVLAKNWIEKQLERYENQGFGHLAVELKNTGDFIGMGGILPRELNGQQEYEIAYSLKPKYWGKGYATEIAQAMKLFGENNIDTSRFISIIHTENIGSANVARKNGMEILFKTEFLGMDVNVFGIEKK